MQKEDYEEMYPDEATPEPEPTTPSSSELDMDSILDKIFNQGMDSLTPEELKFLRNQSN